MDEELFHNWIADGAFSVMTRLAPKQILAECPGSR